MHLPHPTVISATVAGLSIFGFVLLFFRVPRQGLTAMQRIYLSWLCGALVWITFLAHLLAKTKAQHADATQDLVCGVLVLGCFCWGSYWFANLGGGFRILMLLDLAKTERPVTLQDWMNEYGQKRGMREFLDDRLRSILAPLKIVDLQNERVVLSKDRGQLMATLLGILSSILLKKSR